MITTMLMSVSIAGCRVNQHLNPGETRIKSGNTYSIRLPNRARFRQWTPELNIRNRIPDPEYRTRDGPATFLHRVFAPVAFQGPANLRAGRYLWHARSRGFSSKSISIPVKTIPANSISLVVPSAWCSVGRLPLMSQATPSGRPVMF